MLAGGLVMFPISLFTVQHVLPRRPQSIAGWIYLVTFGSVVGYTAYVWLLANAPLGLVSTYAYVNPVVAITLGVLFRGEHLTWRLLIGAAIVVVAVAIVVRREPPAATAPRGGRPLVVTWPYFPRCGTAALRIASANGPPARFCSRSLAALLLAACGSTKTDHRHGRHAPAARRRPR